MKSILVLTSCILLSSCVYHQHTRDHHKGTEISAQRVASVEVGKTTKQWLLANFGIPERTQVESDGLEVFEYVDEHTKSSNKSFIFLFDIDSDKVVERKTARFVMKDGVVVAVNTKD